jgi:hypothetical protein
MIFERNVQEHPNNPHLPVPTSPAIPAHIQTENYIPPVLEASSLAITDRNCGVDEVEIVMHSAHQPAAAAVSAGAQANYSSLDHMSGGEDYSSGGEEPADRRRLSFISFADVVQAEQAEQFSDVLTQHSSNSSRSSPVQSAVDPNAVSTITERLRRSPSPIKLGNSPPGGSGYGERKSPGSPGRSADNLAVGGEQQQRGELTIETMRQALRKTASGDLGVQRSPIGGSFNR